MKKSVGVETAETDSRNETESLVEHTPRGKSNPKNETSTSESVTCEDVARQIRAITDPLTQQLARLYELTEELPDEQAHRSHEETASSRAACSSTGGRGRSYMVKGTLNPAFEPLSTLAPTERLTSPELPPHRRIFSLDVDDEGKRSLQTPHHR